MKHDFIDKFSNLDTAVHRVDPRVKLLLTFLFLILAAATANLKLYPLYLILILVLIAISKVPARYFIKKLLIVTPLAVILAVVLYVSYFIEARLSFSLQGVLEWHPIHERLLILVARIYISILAISLMIAVTRFNDLLWGLRKFRLPMVVTTLSRLVYTYIFVFIDELHRTQRAYKSRTPVRRVPRMKLYGDIAGAILLRSIDRSDYIYKAMISRGFNGEFPDGNCNRLSWNDLAAVLLLIIVTATALLLWKI